MLADLERTGQDQVSLTDPDSRAMARMTKVGVGYNVQLAVDVKHKLIVEQEVCNQVLDMGLLAPTVEAAMVTLGVDRIEAVADKGYFRIEEVEACEKAGITAYLPKPVRGPAVREGFFTKEAFRFDPETNVYTCPAGQTLSPCRRGRSRDNVKFDYANPTACKGCSLRPRCTKTYRHVSRLENEAVLDRMATRLAARPGILDRRRETVEHPVRHHQAMDGSGSLPDATAGERPGRVQPHSARLQHPEGHHPGRGSGPDRSSEGVRQACSDPILALSDRYQAFSVALRGPVAQSGHDRSPRVHPQPCRSLKPRNQEFPHGLR